MATPCNLRRSSYCHKVLLDKTYLTVGLSLLRVVVEPAHDDKIIEVEIY